MNGTDIFKIHKDGNRYIVTINPSGEVIPTTRMCSDILNL